MYRYVAFIWDSNDPEKNRLANSLSQIVRRNTLVSNSALEDDGLIILDGFSRPQGLHAYVLPRSNGVVIGKLFAKNGVGNTAIEQVVMGDREAFEIRKTKGRCLADQYWGQYVAFLRNHDDNLWRVIRDPIGGLYCYRLNYQGINIFFSYIEDIEKFCLFDISVNYRYLAAHMLKPLFSIRETAINEVDRVLPGECISFGEKFEDRCFYWNPSNFTLSKGIDDFEEAGEKLRRVTMDCVSSWASCYDTVIHRLSGGLDSSIVLSCLSKAPSRPNITCLNIHTDRPEADERTFARICAEEARYELHEQIAQAAEADIDRLVNIPKLTVPFIHSLTPEYEDIFTDLAAKKKADAIFSGQGGDHLFHQARTSLISADFAYTHGITRQQLDVSYQVSLLTGMSIWSVLRDTMKYGVMKRPYLPYSDINSRETFLNSDVLETLTTD